MYSQAEVNLMLAKAKGGGNGGGMCDEDQVKKDIAALSAKIGDIDIQAMREGRALTGAEAGVRVEIEAHINELRKNLSEGPLTLQNSIGHDRMTGNGRGYALRGPVDKKDYRSLYGARDGYSWPDKESSFFDAVFSGRFHPGLRKNSMNETVGSDGAFLVPVEYSSQIHNVSLENEIVMPRCFVQPMKSNEIHIPAMTIGDHSANLYGGFTASYTAEAGTINEANPKVRDMELNAKKLTGLIRFSSELAADIPGGEGQIIQICGKGLSWYRDRAFLKGSGAGEPLGLLNAGCTITVAKESGQKADTIVYENLTKMVGRLHPACFNNSVWICQVSAIPMLLQLSMAIGTGGSAIPVLSESGGVWKILTRPVLFSEKTEKLGDKGDIILADLSQYVVGLRSEMRFDMSIHVHFQTDELLARLIERHDGQPLWDAPLTLEDGSTTVSPFVTLAERA
jgi:HK97 family phage major capsid protein